MLKHPTEPLRGGGGGQGGGGGGRKRGRGLRVGVRGGGGGTDHKTQDRLIYISQMLSCDRWIWQGVVDLSSNRSKRA